MVAILSTTVLILANLKLIKTSKQLFRSTNLKLIQKN